MSKWTQFLNSLATHGGAIFILLTMVVGADFAAFVLYLRHDIPVSGLVGLVSTGGALTGALLLALKAETPVTLPTPPAVQATQVPPSPNSPK